MVGPRPGTVKHSLDNLWGPLPSSKILNLQKYSITSNNNSIVHIFQYYANNKITYIYNTNVI